MLDAADVERRVLACGDVAGLTGGRGGVGMAPPGGRRVEGVRDLDPGVEVHVVARWGFTAAGLTDQVRAALVTVTGPIVVVIDDVTTPFDPPVREPAQTPAVSATDPPADPPAGHRPPEPEPDQTVAIPGSTVRDPIVAMAVTGEVDAVIVVVDVEAASSAAEEPR